MNEKNAAPAPSAEKVEALGEKLRDWGLVLCTSDDPDEKEASTVLLTAATTLRAQQARIRELEAQHATSLAAAREQALREAAEICGRISEVKATVWRAGLKADSYIEGECDGADECRMAIEALLHPTRDGGE